MDALPHLVLTPGEPAGIGPDLALELSARDLSAALTVIADPSMLAQRAEQLGIDCELRTDAGIGKHQPGGLHVLPVTLSVNNAAGELNPKNAEYVLLCLDRAVSGCLSGEFSALVTGPVHKGVINDAGQRFSGHTEYLAQKTGSSLPVMMLASGDLKVTLVTTHLPLKQVASAITRERVTDVLGIVHNDLQKKFSIPKPRISVCGLNPHAGESGHMGTEEIDVLIPVIKSLKKQGMDITGPLPADTAFIPSQLENTDVVVAMYHDQGLPVIKHQGFGGVVNVTLGLPIVRTSVDHGTALDLAGTGQASADSLVAAVNLALEMCRR